MLAILAGHDPVVNLRQDRVVISYMPFLLFLVTSSKPISRDFGRVIDDVIQKQKLVIS